MSTDKRNEEEIKSVFSEMPDVKDTRTKEELLTRLKSDERLQDRKPKKTMKWTPAFVAVAAVLIVSLLLPSMLGSQEDKAVESSADMISDESEIVTESAEVQEEMDIELEDHANSPASVSRTKGEVYSKAVYERDIEEGTVFHLGLASHAATSVPVTFIIPNSQIKKDFGTIKPTSLELYGKYASRLDEQALGFTEYHPYKGKVTLVKDELVHILPSGHGYDISSAAIGVYSGTLQDTFYGFKDIRFQNEDGSIVEFDQVGEPSRPLELTSGISHFNYYLFVQEDGRELLSPSFSKSYETVNEALLEMKNEPNDIYATVIPDTINYTVSADADLAKVTFVEQVDLDALDEQKALQMIEGLLLTTASFDKQLQIENITQSKWREFDFSKPLEIPIGPNLMPFLLKE